MSMMGKAMTPADKLRQEGANIPTLRGSICKECATNHGGKWPDGHLATWHEGECDQCGRQEGVCCVTDWDFPGVKLKPAEREF